MKTKIKLCSKILVHSYNCFFPTEEILVDSLHLGGLPYLHLLVSDGLTYFNLLCCGNKVLALSLKCRLRNSAKIPFPEEKNQKEESTNSITMSVVFIRILNLLAGIKTLSSYDLQKVEVQQVKSLYSSNGLKHSRAKDHFIICISFNHSVVIVCSGWGLKC